MPLQERCCIIILQAVHLTAYPAWQAWTEFDEGGRMKDSSYRHRVVDVAEELFKFSLLLRDVTPFLVDRFSERKEKREKGRLLSQAEKEALKVKDVAGKG